MHPFEIMGEPVRRRIVDMLASGEHFSGEIEAIITHEFGVGRSAVQHHLALLRREDWVIVRAQENQRGYRLNPGVVDWLEELVAEIRYKWDRRIGWYGGADPLWSRSLGSRTPSLRGYRGRGRDPDDPWRVRP